MRKSELIALLSDPDIPDDVNILLSSDAEGNAFSDLYEVEYYPESDDEESYPYDLDEMGINTAIILWPV